MDTFQIRKRLTRSHQAVFAVLLASFSAGELFSQGTERAKVEYVTVPAITEGEGSLQPLEKTAIGLRAYQIKEVILKANDLENDISMDLIFFNVASTDIFLRKTFDIIGLELKAPRSTDANARTARYQRGPASLKQEVFVRLKGGIHDSTGRNSLQAHGVLASEHLAELKKQAPGSSEFATLTIAAHAFMLGGKEVERIEFRIPIQVIVE